MKTKFNIGDTVRCISGFTNMSSNNYGGAGYNEGLIFKITNINYNKRNIIWGARDQCGVFEDALELYEEEINYEIF